MKLPGRQVRQPRWDGLAWLGAGTTPSVAAAVVAATVWYGLAARPGALPAAGYLAGLFSGLNIVSISCAGFVLLLTPTGTLPSRRWRWWARAAAAAAGVFVLASALTLGRCTRSTRTSAARSASRPWRSRRWTWSFPSLAWSSWWRW